MHHHLQFEPNTAASAERSARGSLSHALLALTIATGSAAGQNLRPEQKLSPPPSAGPVESDEPVLAAAGANVYAIWFEQDPVSGRDLYYSRSTNGGRSFSSAVRLDQGPGSSATNEPVLVAQDNVVAVFWLDDRQSPLLESVYARISTDGGANFGPEVDLSGPLSFDLGDSDNLVAAIDLPIVAVGFEDDAVAKALPVPSSREDFYVVASTNGGASFTAPQRVNRPPLGAGSADVDDPALTIAGSRVHAVWVDSRLGTADKVFGNTSTNGGLSWPPLDLRIDDGLDLSTDTEDPRIDAEGQLIAVAWRDGRNLAPGLYAIYATGSLDGGNSFLPDARVDGAGAVSAAATSKRGWLDLDGSTAHIAWADNRFASATTIHDIWYRTATFGPAGALLGPEERIDVGSPAGAHDAGLPRVLAADSYVHVFWQDRRDDPLGLSDSLYLRVRSGSGAFGPELPVGTSLGIAGDAEESNFALTAYRDLVLLWGDDRNEPISKLNDVYASGLRLPSLIDVAPPGVLQLAVRDVATVDEGRPFIVAFSISGTTFTPLPQSTTGLSFALSIDAVTLTGLQLLPLFSGAITQGLGLTTPIPGLPIPLIACALLWKPAGGFDFYAASDPILLPAFQ